MSDIHHEDWVECDGCGGVIDFGTAEQAWWKTDNDEQFYHDGCQPEGWKSEVLDPDA